MGVRRASSVCGRCRFISSPSKSALYGAHTHSLKRKVFGVRARVRVRVRVRQTQSLKRNVFRG